MTTQESEAPSAELSAGDANHNWNLRDRLGGIENYEAAIEEKASSGSQEDWQQF